MHVQVRIKLWMIAKVRIAKNIDFFDDNLTQEQADQVAKEVSRKMNDWEFLSWRPFSQLARRNYMLNQGF